MAGWMVIAIVLSVASQCWTGAGERHGEAVLGVCVAMCAAEAVTRHTRPIFGGDPACPAGAIPLSL
jgi:hypothetical protein